MPSAFDRAVDQAHRFVEEAVSPGDAVVDATAGNGGDTLFLAGLVGSSGTVYAFDLQSEAVANTRKLLEREGVLDRVRLVQDDHRRLERYVRSGVSAVMFNLGYRPGSDKEIITTAATTCSALQSALKLMRVGGRLSVVCYPAHQGGLEETAAVEEFCAGLPPDRFSAAGFRLLNRSDRAPRVVIVEKQG